VGVLFAIIALIITIEFVMFVKVARDKKERAK